MQGDPIFHYFVILALLVENRQAIKSSSPKTVPRTIANLGFDSPEAVARLCAAAKDYDQRTPKSFRQQVHAVACAWSRGNVVPVWVGLSNGR